MIYTHRGFVIRGEMLDALHAYVEHGRPVGDFLTAVLANDLQDACGRADDTNLPNLPAFAAWVYNECPSPAHGSREKVKAWLGKFQPERHTGTHYRMQPDGHNMLCNADGTRSIFDDVDA